jgi:tetratricopeptide (TPR) repeat protein
MTDSKKLAADCFKRGNEAMAKENWDYAIQMFSQSVRFQPGNLLFRQTLRGCQKRKYGGNKSGAKMANMKLMGPRGRIKKCRLQKDWEGVDKAAEDGLAVNPWDAQLNADLGDACRKLTFLNIALFAYELAVEMDPGNKGFWRALAELNEEKGEFRQATGCWEKICRIDPTDGDARKRSQQAATRETIKKADLEGADNTRDVARAARIAKKIGLDQTDAQADGPGQSQEADLQRAIRKEPDNVDNYVKLGEFLRRKKKLEDARAMFEKAVELSGGSLDIAELVEDIELDMMKANLDTAKEVARENPDDDDAKKAVGAIAREMLLRETEVLRNRVERYPTDLKIKFRLGECFMKDGKHAQAIPLLQQSSQDTRMEVKALANLGYCFRKEKKYSLARRQYEKAVQKINVHDDADLFKSVHFWLGRLCEASGDQEAAEQHYSEVLAVDYEYRDTLKRLEDLQEGGG